MSAESTQHADYVRGGRVGFTGTRGGMTPMQKLAVAARLMAGKFAEGHHGDCVGADADFDRMARLNDLHIVIHPPDDPKLRAFCCPNKILPERPYLDRNRDIVDACDVLIATPKEDRWQHKGGTWYTISYARQQHKRVVLIWPDGTEEGW